MLTNAQMIGNRFARWAKARKTVAAVKRHLKAGHTVVFSTATKHTKLTAKNLDMIRATKTGVYIQHGKNWICHDYSGISVFGASERRATTY